ncbi:MAG: hypothetical protein GY705_14840 [Bacteroidetes bacterium]|nr:hypothetical protein [Bacteroidota bacterium]
MDRKTHPTYLVWLWFFHYPKHTTEEKKHIECAVAKESLYKRWVAFILWFVMCFVPLTLLAYSDYELHDNIFIGGVTIVGLIIFSFGFSSIIWTYFIRKSKYLCDETIEKILRDGIPISEIRLK